MENQTDAQKTVTIGELAPLLRFCSQSMHYPDASWLTKEYFAGLYSLLDALEAQEEKSALKESVAQSTDFLEDLQVEHTRLFINASPRTVAPPYGSVYRDKSLAGIFSEKIHLFYRESGYELIPGSDFPDSLIHQLEFLSYVAKEENVERFQQFLTRFFFTWFTEFSTRVRAEAAMPFYPVIISLIDFFTKEEEYGL